MDGLCVVHMTLEKSLKIMTAVGFSISTVKGESDRE